MELEIDKEIAKNIAENSRLMRFHEPEMCPRNETEAQELFKGEKLGRLEGRRQARSGNTKWKWKWTWKQSGHPQVYNDLLQWDSGEPQVHISFERPKIRQGANKI